MRWLFLLVICVTCGGCTLFTMLGLGLNNASHMTVDRALAEKVDIRFRILDAESRLPVANPTVSVVHNFDWKDDWVATATAGEDGITTVRTAEDPSFAKVGAPGYLTRGPLYFSEKLREPGVGNLADDVVDIYLYKAPGASWGLRVPEHFEGVVNYRFGRSSTPDRFPFPPDFPAGQRAWWTDVVPGAETIITPGPPLGLETGVAVQDSLLQVAYQSGQRIPTAAPGAEVDGIAAWEIGTLQPKGPWNITKYVLVVGTREAALEKAKQMWAEHRNGRTGWILNGWLRLVSPQSKVQGNSPYMVTRFNLKY